MIVDECSAAVFAESDLPTPTLPSPTRGEGNRTYCAGGFIGGLPTARPMPSGAQRT